MVDIRQHTGESLFGCLQLWAGRVVSRAHLLKRHVQLENFLEQLRRHVFGTLLTDVESFLRELSECLA